LTKGRSSDLVLSGPIAEAIVEKYFIEFNLRFGSSDFNSSIKTATGDLLAILKSNVYFFKQINSSHIHIEKIQKKMIENKFGFGSLN
jgi:hypothetical protein